MKSELFIREEKDKWTTMIKGPIPTHVTISMILWIFILFLHQGDSWFSITISYNDTRVSLQLHNHHKHKIHLSITLTRQMKDFNDINFGSWKKEIEEDIRKLKELHCSWISKINIVKTAILLKAIYRFIAIPIKNSNMIFSKPWKENYQFHMEK